MGHSLLTFFLLTYLVSWICFGGAAVVSRGDASPFQALVGRGGLLLFLGVVAPSLVALGLTARVEGRAGVLALLRRTVRGPAQARWYAFAVGYTAAIKLSVALLHRLITGAWPPFGETPWYVMLGAIAISTPVQAGEEIGWRGYALPRLSRQLGLAPASVVLGVVWAVWHLPLFFIPASDTFGQSFPLYLLQVVALSVALAWLYWRTDGSLLLVMLMHAAVNNTKDIVPSAVEGATDPLALSTSLVAWLTASLFWACAVYFLVRMRRAALG